MAGLGSRVSEVDPFEPMTAAFIPVIAIIAIAIAIVLAPGAIEEGGVIAGFLFSVGGMSARNIGTTLEFRFGPIRGSKEKSAPMANNAPPEMSG